MRSITGLEFQESKHRGIRTVEDAGYLAEEGSNPLSPLRDLNVKQLLHGEGIAKLVGHCGAS